MNGDSGTRAAGHVVQEKEQGHVDVRILYHCTVVRTVPDRQQTLLPAILGPVQVSFAFMNSENA